MHLLKILIIIVLFLRTYGEEPTDKPIFASPLKIPIALSANFGELRYDHFHSGVDIKTQGVTGKEVLATASGYVYRISISPGGFGKAIYLRHSSGYTTVYAHIDKFIPEIEEYIVSKQYEEKSYMVTLWPPKDKFRFNQGDLIAWSGNSGSSAGPHLHYEIRKSDNEMPVNPQLFDLGVEDKYSPVIEELVIYQAGRNTLINDRNKALKIRTTGGNGNYYIPSGSQISISGPAGFGFKSYDLTSNSPNKSSVYSIKLKIDSVPVFGYQMDSFSFNDSKYVNSHIDYETYLKEDEFVERAFVLPNDKLDVYRNLINRGIYNFNDKNKHHIELIVSDIYNNKSSLSFYVNSVPLTSAFPATEDNNTVTMPYNRNNKFVSKNIIVNIPSGTLYDTLWFEFSKTEGNANMYSDIYHVHNRYTPVHKSYTLSIKPDKVPSGKSSKLVIVQLLDNIAKIPLRTKWENGFLVAKSGSFGSFYAGIDTIAPVISPNGLFSGADLSGKQEMRIRITDDFSGIKSYEPVIDGKWALFEYDQKNSALTYKFDRKRITKGTKHYFTLKVSDYKDNTSFYSCEFIW
jgi:hypothetical protein